MRGARIAELGGTPEAVDMNGDGTIEITVVALNPLDLAVAAGRFYGGHPPIPYVPGCEAVGVHDGERLYLNGAGFGTRRDGFLLERTDFPLRGVAIPERIDDAQAAACGIAGMAGWAPVARRAPIRPDDCVLVVGATGAAGSVAVQGAKLLGARRVVAAGRDERRLKRALDLGADAIVQLTPDDLADRFREACGGEGPTHVVDFLWGEPVRAAVAAAAPGARIVHVGQSSGPDSTLPSADVRGKQLEIFGYSNFRLSDDDLASVYGELAGHVAAGRIAIDVKIFSLAAVADAWAAQASGEKAVVLL